MGVRLGIGAGMLALALTTGGCGGSSSTAQPPSDNGLSSASSPSPTPTSKTTPSPTEPGSDLAATCARQPLHLRGPAVRKFGNAALTTAYCSMIAFSFEQGMTHLATARRHHVASEFAFIEPYLTRSARRFWDSEVRKGVAHEGVTQWQNVAGLSLVDLTAFGRFTPPPHGPICGRPSFTPPRTGLFQRGATSEVRLQFTMTCDLALVKKTGPSNVIYRVPFVNQREFTLAATASSSRPWLIDAWVGHFSFAAAPKAVSGSG
jgi:hypothetical protein